MVLWVEVEVAMKVFKVRLIVDDPKLFVFIEFVRCIKLFTKAW